MNQDATTLSAGQISPTDLEAELNSFQRPKLTDAVAIPDSVYEKLPPYLATTCNIFQNRTERDVFLIAALGVISGCLPNVYGLYDNSKVGANLYLFISAPPAAGKGPMKWAKQLATPIHRKFRVQTANELEAFKQEEREYQKAIKNKGEEPPEKPSPPVNQMLFIPANSSAAVVLKALNDNQGRGIMFESEADTLSATLNQDWGNFSDMLRKAFHHEAISQLRKTNDEFSEMENPFLSVILSGTPAQVRKLIPNTENGLFSRFCFYSFEYELSWKPVFAKTSHGSYDDKVDEYALDLLMLYDNLQTRTQNPLLFGLTAAQEALFNQTFERWQLELVDEIGDNLIASIRRLGLITFRIAMILTMIRNKNDQLGKSKVICENDDFMTALTLSEVLIGHAVKMYHALAKKPSVLSSQEIKAAKIREAIQMTQNGKKTREIAELLLGDKGKHKTISNWLNNNPSV